MYCMVIKLLERQRTLSLKNPIESYTSSLQHREKSCILGNKARQSMNKKIQLIFLNTLPIKFQNFFCKGHAPHPPKKPQIFKQTELTLSFSY